MTTLDVAELVRGATALTVAAEALRSAGAPLSADLTALGWAGRAATAAAGAATMIAARGAALADGASALGPHLEQAVAEPWDDTTDRSLAAALDPAARDALVHDRPDLVGGLDGVPAAARDQANRARLAAARRDAEEADRAALTDLLRVRWIGGLARAGIAWAHARARLDRLVAVDTAVSVGGRELLAFDDEHDPDGAGHTRAAVASGDVDTARDIGVFTPGFTAGVADLSDRLRELEAVRGAAGGDAGGTAMVAWFDYDAPQWDEVLDPDRSVLGERSARVGAARLSRFLTGLDAARPRPAHVTAIGHSYGSVVTALATAPGAADGVDDVVVLGSPGVGPHPTRSPGHEYAVEAPGDAVADTGWFGPDPNRMPGVVGLSAREVVLRDGRVLTGSRGHDEYLVPGSTSAYDVAAVVTGRPADAVLDRGVGAGDRLRSLVGG